MSFGFSVGDVITCSKLAFNAYNALKDAPKEFEGLRLEVLSLNATLRALAEEANSPNSIILLASPQRQESLRVLLENCSKGLGQLQVLTKKYPSLGANEKLKFLEHVKFSFQNKNSPRDKLAIHTASINIFLTSLTHSSLGRLEGLIKNALRGAQQKQQGFETQLSNVGFENLGPKSFTALTNTYGDATQLELAEGLDVWHAIEQDLEWEAIRAQDVQLHKDEIVAYIRYLHKGGEPFWKRTGSKSKEDDRNQKQASQPQIYSRDYESRPQTQVPPPAYSPPVPAAPRPAPGRASNDRENARPPQARPAAQPPASRPQMYGHNSSSAESRPYKPSPFSFGQPAAGAAIAGAAVAPKTERQKLQERLSSLDASDEVAKQKEPHQNHPLLPSAQEVQLKEERRRLEQKLESLKAADKKAKEEIDLEASLAKRVSTGHSRASASVNSDLGAPSPDTESSSTAYGWRTNSITGGSLFGAAPASAAATPSGGLFGNAGYSSTSGGLFGAAQPQQIQHADGLSNSTSSVSQAPVDDQQVDDMADLFDHIFDVDEAETAIAQGAELEEPVYSPPTFARPGYPSAAYQVHHKSEGTEAEQIRPLLSPYTPPLRDLPPAITADTPIELQRARARDVKVQLQMLLNQLYTAYRVGDADTPGRLLTPSAKHPNDSPIRLRVAYLRSAGAIVVNCDLCSTPVEDFHWHCELCNGGDWDCCFRCKNNGKGCPGGHQYLSRRSAREWEEVRYWSNL